MEIDSRTVRSTEQCRYVALFISLNWVFFFTFSWNTRMSWSTLKFYAAHCRRRTHATWPQNRSAPNFAISWGCDAHHSRSSFCASPRNGFKVNKSARLIEPKSSPVAGVYTGKYCHTQKDGWVVLQSRSPAYELFWPSIYWTYQFQSNTQNVLTLRV